ncbi:hypothetical protein [Bradyrhizobium sp. BR 1432]|uniref:hypothetical protein n=1 Tax=Bradyrhizobium sp. BR 1432 TaxID=3447966 RepID=UPI003EE57ECF
MSVTDTTIRDSIGIKMPIGGRDAAFVADSGAHVPHQESSNRGRRLDEKLCICIGPNLIR